MFSTLSFWLREADVARATISFFSWAGLAYGIKFLWSPVVDRLLLETMHRPRNALLGASQVFTLLTGAGLLLALLLSLFDLVGWAIDLTGDDAPGFAEALRQATLFQYGFTGLKTIGLVSVAATPLLWAFAWLCRLLNLRGRLAWVLLAQLGVALSLLGMGSVDPKTNLTLMAVFAVTTAFSSATQDIAVDAYRIDVQDDEVDKSLASAYMLGYRVALIAASAGALKLAAAATGGEGYDLDAWQFTYGMMALLMGVGMITAWLSPVPVNRHEEYIAESDQASVQRLSFLGERLRRAASWMATSVYRPFADFVLRYRWQALLILLVIMTYRISDIVMGTIANVFYVDMGFTKDEVANITKVYGIIMTIIGTAIAAPLMNRFGILRILTLGAALSAATNLLFAWLATRGHDTGFLVITISMDNLSAGIATAAFVTYMSAITNVVFSATQYALFTSIMLLIPKFVAGFSGTMVDAQSYIWFFNMTALIGIPVILLIMLLHHLNPRLARTVAKQTGH